MGFLFGSCSCHCECRCICTDLLFVIDTTSSMGGTLGSFVAAMQTVVKEFNSETCKWGVANYRDFEDGGSYSQGWKVDKNFTNDVASVGASISALSKGGGGDGLEQNLAALLNAAQQWESIGGRSLSEKCYGDTERKIKRAILWAGDVIGHTDGAKGLPYPSLNATINALKAAEIKVIAVGGGLGSQATAITNATEGKFLSGSSGSNIDSQTILDAICLALVGKPYTPKPPKPDIPI